jgi:hypothetical protein
LPIEIDPDLIAQLRLLSKPDRRRVGAAIEAVRANWGHPHLRLDVRAEEFLDFVVTADEMEVEGTVERLEDEASLETSTGFVEVRSQAADTHATVQLQSSTADLSNSSPFACQRKRA